MTHLGGSYMQSLEKNQTWELSTLPVGVRALSNKWIFDGSVRYFLQHEGIDYNEMFAPVVKLTTICILLAINAAENLFLEHMDAKIAFPHGDLDEKIYMKQPDGFKVRGKENLVCKL